MCQLENELRSCERENIPHVNKIGRFKQYVKGYLFWLTNVRLKYNYFSFNTRVKTLMSSNFEKMGVLTGEAD
jgi:hypothetical protein